MFSEALAQELRGLVAAANATALQTQAQVHPVAADFQKTLRSL
jgi:hypothetical protein